MHYSRLSRGCFKSTLVILFFVMMFPFQANSQTSATPVEDAGTWLVNVTLPIGQGFEQHDIGTTTEDEEIQISAGGGAGVLVVAGMDMTDNIRIVLEAGYSASSLSVEVENGEGKFNRTHLGGTVYYRKPVGAKATVNVGAGVAMKTSPEMDLDFSESGVQGAAHNIYTYKSGFGFHIDAVYEYFLVKQLYGHHVSFSAGLRYENVEYELDTFTSDGVLIPIEDMSMELREETETLDGSELDVLLGMTVYF